VSIQLLFKQVTGNISEDKFWVGFVARYWDKEASKSVPRCRAIEITSLGLGLALEKRKRDGFSFPVPLQYKNKHDKKVVGRFYVAIDDPLRVFNDFHFLESVDLVFAGKQGLKLAELGGCTSVTLFNTAYKGGELTLELFEGHEAACCLRIPLIVVEDGVRKFSLKGSISDIDGYPGDIDGYCQKHAALLGSLTKIPETLVPAATESPPLHVPFAQRSTAIPSPYQSTITLLRGGNVALNEIEPRLEQIAFQLGWNSTNPDMELDASAFVLNGTGRVRDDSDFIYYHNPASACSSLKLVPADELSTSQKACFQLYFHSIPLDVEKVVVCVTIYDAETRGQNFSSVQSPFIALVHPGNGHVLCRFDLVDHYNDETGVIFGEIYRHKAKWKFRAVGQGYRGGLAAICRHFGVSLI